VKRLLLLVLTPLALAGPAEAATTYYVEGNRPPTSTCTFSDRCPLDKAINLANGGDPGDVIRVLGPYSGSEFLPKIEDGTELIGSGHGTNGTQIFRSGQRALELDKTAKVSNLDAGSNVSTGAAAVIAAELGTRISSVNVDVGGPATTGIRISSSSPTADSQIDGVNVTSSANAGLGLALANGNGFRTIVTDTTVTVPEAIGASGSDPTEPPSVIRRSTIEGRSAVRAGSGHLAISSSVLHVPDAAGAFGVQAGPLGTGSTEAAVDLQNVSVDGSGQGTGVVTSTTASGGEGRVTMRGSIVQNFATDILVDTQNSSIDAGTSDFTPPPTPAGYTDSGGNVDVDPQYADPANGDYRLKPGSPVIDLAGTGAPSGDESATDRAGLPRLADGDDDGQDERDMGAFEFQRPIASFTASPNPTGQDNPVFFDGSASSYPGGAIASYEWDLDGDGSFETGTGATATTTRTYSSGGIFPVKLRVNGADGLSDVATVTLDIVPILCSFCPPPSGAPEITSAFAERPVFRVGRQATPLVQVSRAKVGTAFRYTLSKPAAVDLAIQRRTRGRRVGGRCQRTTRRNRRRRRCTLWLANGTLKRTAVAGPNRTPFSGRLGQRVLKPARYRAVITATDAGGSRSAPARVLFRIVRR